MNQRDLKLTDLDYAIADHHNQMLKAALPYMEIPQQRILSMFVKTKELVRTIHFFDDHDMGMLSVCDLDQTQTSPSDMLEAVKPYANPKEQEMIDLLTGFFHHQKNKANRTPYTMEQLFSILPPEQQSKLETIQLMIQVLRQN